MHAAGRDVVASTEEPVETPITAQDNTRATLRDTTPDQGRVMCVIVVGFRRHQGGVIFDGRVRDHPDAAVGVRGGDPAGTGAAREGSRVIQRIQNRLEPVVPAAVCPHCEFGNRPGSDFCGACGAPLQVICSACGTHNPPRFRFCGGCGASLESLPATASAGRIDVAEPEPAERRQLTVMFCDLVGSTALSLDLDPEEFREVLRSYQTVCAEAIERFDGYVAQYLGDGVLGYFGWPRALENEAERAVRAGLRVAEEMGQLDAQLRKRIGPRLAVRVGIHTGLVVVSEVGAGLRRENLALGGTPNIAARLQALAQPNSVVVSGVTRRLVARQFQCEDLGELAARDVPGTGSVFRVVGERQRPRGTHRSPLVGRNPELATIRERWDRAVAGEGQAITIVGDAGIGKSHLIDEFMGGIGDTTRIVLEGRCLPYYQNTALYPFIEMLERELRQEAGDDPQAMVSALRAMLERDGMDVDDSLPLFGALLQLPVPDAPLSTDSLTERTRAALIRMVLRNAECCPVVLIIEDLHWADASTLELIRALMANAWRGRVLALFTTRPGFTPPWQATDHAVRIELQRLAQSDAERIIERLAGSKRLPREVVQHIVAKTDGVPLFVEELCKMVLQSGMLEEHADAWTLTRPLPHFAIPDTLQDWLEVRLDRLSAVKEIAQLGAMLGREFSFDVLRAVAHVDEAVVRHSLAQLVEAELILVDGPAVDPVYTFKHALIQEAAYESLLRSTRQRHHERIATVLESRFPDVAGTEPETLARHWSAAELPARAVPFWLEAGQRAMRASAYVEAAAHLRRGLDQLHRLPDSPERLRTEIELQAALGGALIATEGYISEAVKELNSRALELCRRAGDTSRLPFVMSGLFAYFIVRGDLGDAGAIADEFAAIARNQTDDGFHLLADTILGIVHVNRGELSAAKQKFQAVLARYDTDRHRTMWTRFSHDPKVLSHSYLGLVLWLEGFPLQASASDECAVAWARELDHAHSLAFALSFEAAHYRLCRQFEEAAGVADELLALARDKRFRLWQADALMLQAYLLTERRQPGGARERLDEALTLYGASGTAANPYYKLVQARVLAGIGQVDDAIRLMRFDPDAYDPKDYWWWIGEQCQLLGDLLSATPGGQAEAATWYNRSMQEAMRQQAMSTALRTATAHARLLINGGDRAAARQLLEPVYAWFTEGFELPDLKAAAALLQSV